MYTQSETAFKIETNDIYQVQAIVTLHKQRRVSRGGWLALRPAPYLLQIQEQLSPFPL
ncbi:MAG: hypothetical protein KUG82_13985 [Pseudomonadales bacterium]|nr:hypothetical protein [Pseudomonadales bacterium]